MLTQRYFRLRTFGRLALSRVAGDAETPVAVRPRHLAVLTVVATARRPMTRDALLEMFWGGETEARARHSLSNALSGLRAVLGTDAITARSDVVTMSERAHLEIDVVQYVAACESRDDERITTLYGGTFLDGVYVPDAPGFEAWLGRERSRLERLFAEACERQVPAFMRSARWVDAASLAERWMDATPQSAAAFAAIVRAHAGPDTDSALAAAVDAYEARRRFLFELYGTQPDAAVVAVVHAIHDRRAALRPATMERPLAANADASVIGPEKHTSTPISVGSTPTRPAQASPDVPRPRTWAWRIAAGMAVMLATAGIWAVRHRAATAATAARPSVAVEEIEDVRGDTAIAWLRAGLSRMIASDLQSVGGVDVVPVPRIRDVIARLAGSDSARLTEEQALDVARRVGAAWVVTGNVSSGNKGYLLDITVRNIADPRTAASFTVLSGDPIDLGRQASVWLASAMHVPGAVQAASYANLGTGNPEAYRHYVHGELASEGLRLADAAQELDAALALDSNFVEAMRSRAGVAYEMGDTATLRRVHGLMHRLESRLPEFDRLSDEITDADTLAETRRAAVLAQRLVERFPYDPRAYNARADIYLTSGEWAAAESTFLRELALDSLAIGAGDGPCAPCLAFSRLAEVRLFRGDAAGAEAASRQWVVLQPDLPAAWLRLSATLAAVGKPEESMRAGRHHVALARDTTSALAFARVALSNRAYDVVDSIARSVSSSRNPMTAEAAVDLRAMLMRERGQFVASVAELAGLPMTAGPTLVRADGLARVGRIDDARLIWETTGHPRTAGHLSEFTAPEARGYSWSHALEADWLARVVDTTAARHLVDSLVLVSAQSYYGRDKHLADHVRGLLAFEQHRFSDAEQFFKAAEWMAGGWTRTNVELARAQLALNRPHDAVRTLRDAYLAPLDAMGRYVPRSEIDWWMARAFMAAGQPDSARVYSRYVRAAWSNADAVVRARLDSLP